jgi:hypothetical protein
MKNLLSVLILLSSLIGNSQTITVTWNRTRASNFHGNSATIPEFAREMDSVFDVGGNGKKELDLEKMESRFYEDNILKSVLKIKSVQKTNENRLLIILEDFDLRNGKNLETYQVIDFKKQKSYYSWYYDGKEDITWVYDEYGGKISLK